MEIIKKYSLGLDNLQSAVSAVLDLLGMQACENSGVVADGARSHAVNLTGQWYGGVGVLARAGFMLDAKHGVTLKIAVRSPNQRGQPDADQRHTLRRGGREEGARCPAPTCPHGWPVRDDSLVPRCA